MLGITVPVVKNCPVTRGSEGVIEMTPEMISQIAGAVRDEQEWLCLLIGKRSAIGDRVTVESFRFPEQRRGAVDVNVDNVDMTPDVVGVMHSHHTMGAFFSGTDEGSVNKKFPTSIVVSSATNVFGFEYKAVGKVTLPCGAMGKIDFSLSVKGANGEKFDDLTLEPIQGEEDPDNWGDCSRITTKETPLVVIEQTACGYKSESPAPFRFGMDGAAFLAQVKAATKVYAPVQRSSAYKPRNGYFGGYGGIVRNWWEDKPKKKKGRGAKAGAQIFRRNDGKPMNCDYCDSGPWTWLKKTDEGDYACMTCFKQLETGVIGN